MSVSSVTSTPAIKPHTTATTTRAADGDYLVKSAKTSQTKDADGDYKPATTTSSPASVTTSAVHASLQNLEKGG